MKCYMCVMCTHTRVFCQQNAEIHNNITNNLKGMKKNESGHICEMSEFHKYQRINLNLRILTFSAQNLKQIDQIKKTGKEI